MHIDKYTKCVLTAIAVCLIWLSLGGPALLPTAHAQQPRLIPAPDKGATHVMIEGWIDANGKVYSLDRGVYPLGGGVPVTVVAGPR